MRGRYIDSEADLFGAVASFTFLSQHPSLYPTFVDSGALPSMVKLFAHENVDIAISVLEVLVELTAEDVEYQKEEDMAALIDGLFKDDGMGMMVGNLERLDETKEDDRRGVFHTLSTPPKSHPLFTFAPNRFALFTPFVLWTG
jgi:beta-catenin-like protein 1